MAFIDQVGVLDEDEAGPRYLRLQKLLRSAIEGRRLALGSALPSERELGDLYALSRVTIRKAIDQLVDDGLLERRKGAGTFVAGPAPAERGRVEKSISKLSSFSEDMLSRGRKPASRWLDRSEGMVTPDEALSLGLSPGSPVYRFQRIRYADGETMAFEHVVVPAWGLPSADAVEESLYEALDLRGYRPVRVLQRVRAVGFSAKQAELLGVAEGDPCLFIDRRAFLPDDRVIEVAQCYYRGDAYDLVAELSQG
ncbi:GntR family transcriptional regulator [Novosphingobium umbonatum]|jgi:GntR family transcriptional regulator|uniref:GntR family transcriptional regulator n=1 Tax=Novosphingobium umbonatum TaxID=1908524 RepID=A0A437NAL6_9SPHN|nr:GntR family transcriptional regulator [Novosphingobium umbonatum]RVU06994.1 GntR family transcriptional regulator [Novosphingobium umbonatum]